MPRAGGCKNHGHVCLGTRVEARTYLRNSLDVLFFLQHTPRIHNTDVLQARASHLPRSAYAAIVRGPLCLGPSASVRARLALSTQVSQTTGLLSRAPSPITPQYHARPCLSRPHALDMNTPTTRASTIPFCQTYSPTSSSSRSIQPPLISRTKSVRRRPSR
jgi:hypothetical protein